MTDQAPTREGERAAESEEAAAGTPIEEDAGAPMEEDAVDGLPVLAEVRALDRPAPALPAVQAAAVAATGFVAGAATVALVKRHSARKLARNARNPRRAVEMLPIVGSRTFLIDLHMVAKPGE